MKTGLKVIFVLLALILLTIIGYFGYHQYKISKINSFDDCAAAGLPVQASYPARCVAHGKTFVQNVSNSVVPPTTNPTAPTVQIVGEPISNSLSRITKKPFGIYVTPSSSPVQPEKFTGYHTGTDFETTSSEANNPVPISAICDGTARYKNIVQGYGGVIIASCTINNQVVTVLYGHIDLATSVLNVGSNISRGTFIANLAPSYSTASGGERKHLHLGIHLGTGIDYRGYVQNQTELTGWLNYQDLYK